MNESMSTRSRSEKLTDIWHMTNSPVRLGDARATWSHENTTPTKDKRPSIVKVRENHEWIDRRVQMIEELEKGTICWTYFENYLSFEIEAVGEDWYLELTVCDCCPTIKSWLIENFITLQRVN